MWEASSTPWLCLSDASQSRTEQTSPRPLQQLAVAVLLCLDLIRGLDSYDGRDQWMSWGHSCRSRCTLPKARLR